MRQLFWILFFTAVLIAACTTPALGRELSVEQEIVRAARKYRVEPEIAVAVAKIESNFNQAARGDLGEVGIFQLRPEFHEGDAIYSRSGNIDAGVKYLAYVRAACRPRYGSAYVVCFNLGPNSKPLKHPALFPYYRRVIAAMDRS